MKISVCFVSSLKIISRHYKVKKDLCERGLFGLSSLQFSALYLKPLIQTQGILRGTIDKSLHRSQAPWAAICNYPNCAWQTCTALQVNLRSGREAGVKKKNHSNKLRKSSLWNLPVWSRTRVSPGETFWATGNEDKTYWHLCDRHGHK